MSKKEEGKKQKEDILLCEVSLTLEQRLALFDPSRHGGEEMAVEPLGGENEI